MRVVKRISTGRIVYRESPDFEWGKGIPNAAKFPDNPYPVEELEEVEVTQAEWDAELALREAERPRRLGELLDTTYPNPQREAFKLSQLHGLTYQQLMNYIQNQIDSITSLAEAKVVFTPLLQKMAALEFWLYKQNKLDK